MAHATPAIDAFALSLTVTLVFASGVHGGDDPWADTVEHFDQGVDGSSTYADPATALGEPARYTGELFGYPGVVSPFSPAFDPDEIVSLGRGGVLELRFDTPVTDDPGNPFGIDLLIFGNAGFSDAAFPSGTVGGLLGADGGVVEVSADGATWVTVPGLAADGLLPTRGYLDSGPYDIVPGREATDFTRPVDPSVTLDDLMDLTAEEVNAVYGLSGGGAGVDLAGVGLAAICCVRITNPVDATLDIEIDAVSDVAPGCGPAGDIDGDCTTGFDDLLLLLAAWGPCGGGPCPADLDGDGSVGFADLLEVLTNWSA